ncbi:MAG: ABC transporter permease, partial [Alphaproteobacteria bacterium]
MRAVFLVARREYLAYVTAWGFWLGLILTPLGLMVGVVLPSMIVKSQPVRYYSVIDDRPDFIAALGHELESRRADAAKSTLAASLSDKPKEVREAALNRFAQARLSGLDAAGALAKAEASDDVKPPPENYIRIEPPGRTQEALAPYLAGAQKLSGPAGERQLFAALVVSRDASSKITEVDYW